MIIVDTSIWIEYFRCHSPYFNQLRDLLSRNEVGTLSAIFGELLNGAKNNAERSLILEHWQALSKIPENDLFVRAGLESGKNKWADKGVALIDAAIITAARETASFIWSLDQKLLRLLKREEIFTYQKSVR